jgi:hypothetical protein
MTELKPKPHILLAVFLTLVILVSAGGCQNSPSNAGEGTPAATRIVQVTPPAASATTPEFITALQRFIKLMKENGTAPIGLPEMVDSKSPGSGPQQQLNYFSQAFQKAAKDKKISSLDEKAEYVQRGLTTSETNANTVVSQYKDSLTSAFVINQDKTSSYVYLVEAQGAVFQLYLFAQTESGEVFFEQNPAKAGKILDNPDLKIAQWVAGRQITGQDKGSLTADQWIFLQGMYSELHADEEPARLEDIVAKGPVWIMFPVLSWDAQTGRTTAFISPGTLAVHLEDNPAYTARNTDRGIMLRLPIGEIPTSVKPQATLPAPTEIIIAPTATATITRTLKSSPTKKPGKETATPEATALPTQDAQLIAKLESFEDGSLSIPNEKLFRSSQGESPLGVADTREVGMSWGFFVQGIYLGNFEVLPKNSTTKILIAIFGFMDAAGNPYFIPFQLGVDVNHSIILEYDPNRTVSSVDNERPETLKVLNALDMLRANLNEPVLVFMMRAAPPFPFSDSDTNYIRAHESQYSVADQALRFIKTAAAGDIKQMQVPDYVNSLNLTGKILPLVENLILPQKP